MKASIVPITVGGYSLQEATQLLAMVEGNETPMNVRRLAQYIREVKFEKLLGISVLGEGAEASVVMSVGEGHSSRVGTFREVVAHSITNDISVVTNAGVTFRNLQFDSKKIKKLVTEYLYKCYCNILSQELGLK